MDVFVFGSNYHGRHGKGAAKHAFDRHGAQMGISQGMMGRSYALPTKGFDLRKALPLDKIREHVELFIKCATRHPFDTFYVTAIGTGLAGYSHEQIAPMFDQAPSNCRFPLAWKLHLKNRHSYQFYEGYCKCQQF